MGQYFGRQSKRVGEQPPNPFDFTRYIEHVSTLEGYHTMVKAMFYDKITCGRLIVLKIFTRQLCVKKPHLLPSVEIYNMYVMMHKPHCVCDLTIDTTGFD